MTAAAAAVAAVVVGRCRLLSVVVGCCVVGYSSRGVSNSPRLLKEDQETSDIVHSVCCHRNGIFPLPLATHFFSYFSYFSILQFFNFPHFFFSPFFPSFYLNLACFRVVVLLCCPAAISSSGGSRERADDDVKPTTTRTTVRK